MELIGAIGQATRRLELGTAVTCPSVRIHPALVAQAAATCALLMEGRFFLGLGTGENLNEHIVGQGWPETEVRQERLLEAVQVIRLLWGGGNVSHRGRHFTLENARLYSRPETPPPLLLAVGGPCSADLTGSLADGMIGTDADAELTARFERAGGAGKPRYAELTVCWGASERAARRLAKEVWPTAAMEGSLSPGSCRCRRTSRRWPSWSPRRAIAEPVVCGPDPERHLVHALLRARNPAAARRPGQRGMIPGLPGKPFRPVATPSRAARATARSFIHKTSGTEVAPLTVQRRTRTWRRDA